MEADGELARSGNMLDVQGADGRAQVELYARLLENFVEGYRVGARGLGALLRGAIATKDFVRRAMTAGERMFLAGEIARREAVSSPMLENAFASFDHESRGLRLASGRQARAHGLVRDGGCGGDDRVAHRRDGRVAPRMIRTWPTAACASGGEVAADPRGAIHFARQKIVPGSARCTARTCRRR